MVLRYGCVGIFFLFFFALFFATFNRLAACLAFLFAILIIPEQVVGGEGHSILPTVSKVEELTPADGRLLVGDMLLAVNGRDLADGTHQEVRFPKAAVS